MHIFHKLEQALSFRCSTLLTVPELPKKGTQCPKMTFQVIIWAMNVQSFADKLRELGICSRIDENQWLHHSSVIPLRYEPYALKYQRQYWISSEFEELSKRSLNSGELYWPLIISSENSRQKITSDGKHIFPPILLGSKNSQSSYQRNQLNCLNLLQELSKNYEIGQVEIRSDFRSHAHPWIEFAINSKIEINFSFEDVLNLGESNEEIFSNFKDSTRRDIIKGLEMYDIEILEGEFGAINLVELRELHARVSGRVTRDSVTWEIQKENLLNDKAILILCREKESREIISGSYFEFNQLEASYGVSATNRSYFKTPVNHVMQWKAIEYFNSRKISFYRLGRRYNAVSDDLKLQNIGKFKRKFTSHFESIFTLDINT
jgi:FemAB family protein